MDLISGIFIMLIVLLLVGGICLGLLIALVAGQRQNVAEQRHTVGAESTSEVSASQGNQTQLDRIEALVQKTHISGVRLAGLSIGLAAVIFAGTGLQISLGDRVLVFVGGLALILLSWRQDSGKCRQLWTRTTHAGSSLIENVRRSNKMARKERPGEKLMDKRLTDERFTNPLDRRIDPQTPGRKLRKSLRNK
jgi:hypothetical protein